MRTVSPDESFIDYTIYKFGVRVRRGSCRTIMRTGAGWEEYGEEVRLPVPAQAFDPSGNEGWGDLSSNVIEYEELAGIYDREEGGELRRVLAGTIDLETALRRRQAQATGPGTS